MAVGNLSVNRVDSVCDPFVYAVPLTSLSESYSLSYTPARPLPHSLSPSPLLILVRNVVPPND